MHIHRQYLNPLKSLSNSLQFKEEVNQDFMSSKCTYFKSIINHDTRC